jgi:predicted 2-oxoglutarate/Fe(II)-dependent dioxygenase YbiX
MPGAGYFGQFGLFTVRRFLSLDECAEVRIEMETAHQLPGTVWNPLQGDTVAVESKRRTEMIGLPLGATAVRKKIQALMPELAAHFAVVLSGLQPLKFVRYDEGDFYGLHRDVTSEPTAPDILRERKVSVVIFLGAEGEEPEDADYCGGNLTFYGLLPGPEWQNVGHPLNAEAGLLIAFSPEVPHEVTPVTWGHRHTVTTWFH